MVADLMGDHVGLREFARGPESLLQFIKETEIEVDLLVTGTVERTGGRIGPAAGRLNRVAEKHQLGMAVGSARGREQFFPGVLHVVNDERDELNFAVTVQIPRSISLDISEMIG